MARRQAATMRRAEAAATPDDAERDRLTREATEADALAVVLDERVQQLAEADDARALWFAHTAETRAAADRAEAELSARRCTDVHDEPTVTAEEWLAAHAEDARVEDHHREVADDAELTEVAEQRGADIAAVEQEPHPDAAETGVADIRAVVADEPAPVEYDKVRVPTADETADTIARAQRALLEIEQRQAVEQRHADEQTQAIELTRRNTEDVAEQQAADEAAEVFG